MLGFVRCSDLSCRIVQRGAESGICPCSPSLPLLTGNFATSIWYMAVCGLSPCPVLRGMVPFSGEEQYGAGSISPYIIKTAKPGRIASVSRVFIVTYTSRLRRKLYAGMGTPQSRFRVPAPFHGSLLPPAPWKGPPMIRGGGRLCGWQGFFPSQINFYFGHKC